MVLDDPFTVPLYINLTGNNFCMAKGVTGKNQFKRSGGNKGPSKNNKSAKKVSPLAQAYLNMVNASNQAQEIQSALAPAVYKEMMIGLNSEKKSDFLSTHTIPYFFANNVDAVYSTEMRKLEKHATVFDIDTSTIN